MRNIESPFEIKYDNVPVRVIEAELMNRRAFSIVFSTDKPPISITVAHDRKNAKFWTSIP